MFGSAWGASELKRELTQAPKLEQVLALRRKADVGFLRSLAIFAGAESPVFSGFLFPVRHMLALSTA